MRAKLKRLVKDTSGQGLIAHVLLISGAILMVAPTVQNVGARLADVFHKLTDALR